MIDLESERALLAHMFVYPNDPCELRDQLVPEDFADPQHQALWDAWVPGEDIYAVAERVGVDRTRAVAIIAGDCANTASAHATAARVIEARGKRDVEVVLRTALDALELGEPYNAIRERLERDVGLLEDRFVVRGPSADVDAFTAGDDPYQWVIPDLLEERDRLLITAAEGQGKSVLMAQIAVMAAAGVHPFTGQPIEPVSTLYVDLENGPHLVRRRLRALRAKAQGMDPGMLRVEARQGGIDVTKRSQRQWLAERVLANGARLVVLGPLYRLYGGVAERGDVGGEDLARRVVSALDRVRERTGAALVLETHAPHAGAGQKRDLRPFGSSVWLRWPEFGIGLSKDPKNPGSWLVDHWRGPRDRRVWPSSLHRGGVWPWEARFPTGTFNKPPAMREAPKETPLEGSVSHANGVPVGGHPTMDF